MTSTWTASLLALSLVSTGEAARTRFESGIRAMTAGQYWTAAEAFKAAAHEAPHWGLAHLQWGIALQLYAPEDPNVLLALERAVELEPNNARANFALGTAYLRVSRQTEGIARLEKTLGLRDDYPQARFLLARALASVGQNDRAISEMLAVLRRAPDHSGAMLDLAVLYEKESRLADAEGMLRRIASLHPNSAYHFVRIAKFYERVGEHRKASQARAHAEVIDPRPKRKMRPLRRRR